MCPPICTNLRRKVSFMDRQNPKGYLTPMTTIAEVAGIVQTLLTTTADDLAKTDFIERKRKVTGSGFAQALIFSFMANPAATRAAVNQTAANAGMMLSTAGLEVRPQPHLQANSPRLKCLYWPQSSTIISSAPLPRRE